MKVRNRTLSKKTVDFLKAVVNKSFFYNPYLILNNYELYEIKKELKEVGLRIYKERTKRVYCIEDVLFKNKKT
tara:strand:- start:994 stop:1212 length:219 start_codon:yes stop_codon:yes gene_type:complete